MRRYLISILGMLFLGACASSQEATPTPVIPITATAPALEAATFEVSCSAVSTEPTLAPSAGSLFPPVDAQDFTLGPSDAPVTILEYCDFQADGCSTMAAVTSRLMQTHENVRFVFRPFPLAGVLDKSEQAVMAALAADAQGKFWEIYNLLFDRHEEWKDLPPDAFPSWLLREAEGIGLDAGQLDADMRSDSTRQRMDALYEKARTLTIPAVPLVLINGVLQPSFVLDYQSMSDAIGLILLGEKQFTSCPSFGIDPLGQYIATIQTERGNIIIQLFADKAPLAVNSFVFLAHQGWYDGVTFHRVIPGFAAQAGDPSGTGRGTPGYFFKNEKSDLKFDQPGRVAMANFGPDTNGSQFFITFADTSHLDGQYTIFGQVISGLEVAEQLTPRDPSQGGEQPPASLINRIEIEER